MSTEFIGFQPPPGDTLEAWDRTAYFDAQPSSIPPTFKDAMSVREEVFVKDQGVPLSNELDDDDPRSFHWVAYASVGNAPQPTNTDNNDGSPDAARRTSESTASRVAVGTIRLVPPPHTSHAEHKKEGRADSVPPEEPEEPYIKLGRIATLHAYRGLGLSRLLINAALNWAKDHPSEILPPLSPAEAEAAKLEGRKETIPWKGLILVHAQVQVQKLWESFGFVKDEGMGTWDEEGIDHVGLWRKVEVKGIV